MIVRGRSNIDNQNSNNNSTTPQYNSMLIINALVSRDFILNSMHVCNINCNVIIQIQ